MSGIGLVERAFEQEIVFGVMGGRPSRGIVEHDVVSWAMENMIHFNKGLG